MNKFKLSILLFSVLFLFQNCQKEDDLLITDNDKAETYKTVTLDDVLKLKPIVESIIKVRPIASNIDSRTGETFLGLDNVLTENIIQITNTTNVSTYTFNINTNFETTGYLENLHLVETGQDYVAYIIRYIPDATWATNPDNYTPEGDLVLDIRTFQGDKTKYTLDREVVWSTIPPDNARGTWIEVCTFSLVEFCTNDGGGGPEGSAHVRTPNCTGPYFTGGQETCTTVYAHGGYSNNDNSNGNPDGDDGTTNGGGYAYNDDCEEVTGTLIQDSQPISSVSTGCTTNDTTGVAVGSLDCLLDMPSDLANILNQLNDSVFSEEINNFLSLNSYSCDAYKTAILLAESNLEVDTFDDFEDGPSCESFNFQQTTSDAYWQNAAVKNIRFRVVVLSPQGNYVNFDIKYSQPILFGVPTNTVIDGDISSGLAAELSAQALSVTMSDVVNAYGNQPVSELQVRLYFEQRLKHNYPIITNGGRVTLNPMTLSVIPTEYQTNFFGTGNCD